MRSRQFSLALLLCFGCAQANQAESVKLVILGVAQDAGFPQHGCYEERCIAAWRDPRHKHQAVSLGLIDEQAKTTYLFGATPAMPDQLYRLHKLAPKPDYKLGGVFLSHAHIGHYSGLMYFGQEAQGAKDVPVIAMPRMQGFLSQNGPWSQLVELGNIRLNPLQDGEPQALGTISVTPMLVPHRDEFSETVGFRINGPKKSAAFIPDIDKWEKWATPLEELIKNVDYAFLDATFFDHGELSGRDMSKIPHPLVSDTMRSLSKLSADEKQKVWFIHFNHTNPLLKPQSSAAKLVRNNGFNVAIPRMEFEL
ncbi:MAG: pyrroloquinoline quinone biosynthesis protein B [Cryomorphaceae bacterium]|jgi:pyrroloquinoline quinone biosynthesis protein B